MLTTRRSLIAAAIISTFTLAACGGGSSSSPAPTPTPTPTPTSTPEPTNSAPADVSLSTDSVYEHYYGAVIGELSATDADGDDITFTTASDIFEIVNNTTLKLQAEQAFDYETAQSAAVTITATDGTDSTTAELTVNVTDFDGENSYEFDTKLDGVTGSSVSYTGQIARHLLIEELNYFIGNDLKAFAVDKTAADIVTALEGFAGSGSISDDENQDKTAKDVKFLGDLALLDAETIADISSGKNLWEKIAGNDAAGQHKVWNDGQSFIGWSSFATTEEQTPTQLVNHLFAKLAANVISVRDGAVNSDYLNTIDENPFITPEGVDLQQLIEKFLLGAVAFSQGADDYLDDADDDKGIKTSNVGPQKPDGKYTKLEHQYDEGYGYFGAARNYLAYTDEEVSGKGGRDDWQGYHDTNSDSDIDLRSEFNFGNSTNASKRDLGSQDGFKTDLSEEAYFNFYMGRKLINDNVGTELNDEQQAQLKHFAEHAVLAWEKSIAATVVHYINDVSSDLAALNDADTDFNFGDLAKHFSEMKGFALNLQFNPESPLSDADFAFIQNQMGDTPVSGKFASTDGPTQAEITAYVDGLVEARNRLATAYNFAAENAANW